MDEQRLAVPEAPTPGVHPAAEGCDGCLCRRNVVLLAVLVGLVPAALVVMVMLVVVASVTAALARTHAAPEGSGQSRPGRGDSCGAECGTGPGPTDL